MIKNIVRALRLPFITASMLPFIFGSLIDRAQFSWLKFILGLVAVIAMHLFANLINDYADSKSGADWQDKKFYGFFGGSKLIQEGVLSEKFYLSLAIIFAFISIGAVAGLMFLINDVRVVVLFVVIIVLSFSYSAKPLQLSYRKVGEVIIFLLFGPALVMGGYFIQTGIFPDVKSFVLSVPFGLMVTAILFVNEIPDFGPDKRAGKLTWVSLIGPGKAFIIYGIIMLLAFFTISLNISFGYLRPIAAISLILILAVIKVSKILMDSYEDKRYLIKTSKITIAIHTWVSLILICSTLL